MLTRHWVFVCVVILAALFLPRCGTVSRVEEPPVLLRTEEPILPMPQIMVAPPETKTALCPDCAARIAPSFREAAPRNPTLSDIYFGYDRSDITTADAQILRRNMEWFRANPKRRVRVEGYCDERGTGEYNIRLGQRRAEAAKNFLVRLGVNGRLLEVATYGSERPGVSGHNLQVWSRNRRVHFAPL